MSSLRQLGSGLFYALVSVVLVVGGLSLAIAEGGAPPGPEPQPSPQAPSAVPASPQASLQPSFTAVPPSATTVPAASAAPQPASSSTPVVIYVTSTSAQASAAPYVPPRATATHAYYATAVHCGPYGGWIKGYVVKQGDTLFHISTLYRTTVPALQTANCLASTFIYPGQLLWVPNVPTITPGVTFVPTFATPTLVPTEPLTLTPVPYFTETSEPTPTLTGNTGP